MNRTIAALLLALTLAGPASAAETTTVDTGNPGANQIVSTEAPAALKTFAADRARVADTKRNIAIALIVFMTAAGMVTSYLTMRRTAEFDGMTSNAYMRWVRDRNMR